MSTPAEFMECQTCLCTAARRAARGITTAFDRRLRPYGLRTTQFTILVNLMLRGRTPIGALAKLLGLERTTLTRNVAVLARRGFLQGEVDGSDSRAHVLRVTSTGEAIVHEAFEAWREAQQRVASILGQAGVEAVHQVSRSQFRA